MSSVQFPPVKPDCPKCRDATTGTSKQTASACTHTSTRHYIGPIPVQPSHAKAIALAIADDIAINTSHLYPEPLDNDHDSRDHVSDTPISPASLPAQWTNPFPPSPVSLRPPPVRREPSAVSTASYATAIESPTKGLFKQRTRSFPVAHAKTIDVPPSSHTKLAVPPRSMTNVRSADNLRNQVTFSVADSSASNALVPTPRIANARSRENAQLRKVKSADSTLATSRDTATSLLHPNWTSPARERPISPHNNLDHNKPDADAQLQPSDDRTTEASHSPTRARLFPAHVGRGFPAKRDPSFPRIGSSSTRQASHAGIHLPYEHARDVSRQSRISRASTVGTFNTIGTVLTEGSFGATTGAAQRLSRRIFTSSNSRRRNSRRTSDPRQARGLRSKLTLVRSNSVARNYEPPTPSTVHTRHASSPFAVRRLRATESTPRQLSMTTETAAAAETSEDPPGRPRDFKGLLPGAVGTSGGGTKWVGQSFVVGKRFYDVIEARRVELQRLQPCSCKDKADGQDQPPQLTLDTEAVQKAQDRAVQVERMKQSPDGVITLLAQEAQGASDSKTLGKSPPNRMFASLDSALTKSGRRSSLTKHLPSPSIISAPKTAPIEAQQGWDDIVSKMSTLAVTRSAPFSPTTPGTAYQSAATSIAADKPAAKPLQDHRSIPNLKIMARSSSLVESSEPSLTESHGLQPPQPNGFAQRASSLARSPSASPASFDAMSHPSPPSIVEESDPQLVHALLRRKSDIGVRPDVMSDAASDHCIAARPVTATATTPLSESGLQEQDPISLDKTPANEAGSVQPQSIWKTANLLKPAFSGIGAQHKKKVQFQNGTAGQGFSNRFTASLFAGSADDAIESVQPGASDTLPGDTKPKPPEEVLARPQPDVMQSKDTDGSPGSEFGGSDAPLITRKTVLKKDRMLVKLAWTSHEDLPKDFDELQARKYTIRDENWREFIVVFRMGKLELWDDATLTSKIAGHGDRLKLRHTIPLSRGSTFVSLFSPIDRIFAITYQPWKIASSQIGRKGGIHLRRHGTEIVLFDCRARSAAVDWMWELWRELGGLIPESLELHVPSFGLKIKLPIPQEMPIHEPDAKDAEGSKAGQRVLALSSIGTTQDVGEGFKLINRANIIALTWKLFQGIPEWRELTKESEEKGLRLELAWRRGTELDWVYNERTVDNEPRHWAVLCGSLLRDYKLPSMLELRVAEHYPTTVLSAPGTYLQEPPAVEGYLWRLKPVSGALTRLYLTTYDGHLYICRASRAFQPDRHLAFQLKEVIDMRVPRTNASRPTKVPEEVVSSASRKGPLARALAKFIGKEKAVRRDEDLSMLRQNVLEAISYPAETDEEMQTQIEACQSFERRRQFEQIRNSDGFIDLKLIYMIKTIGSGPVRCPGMDDLKKPSKQQKALYKLHGDAMAAQRDDEESDVEDESDVANDIGGTEGLNRAADSDDLRKSRQVELTLSNGKSFRLEAFSASVAREWVEKISELVRYWRRRERADATELMYASGVDLTELNKHLQGRGSKKTITVEVADEERLSPILGNIWNWCAIEGCRNIIRSGRLFHKRTKYGAFKARDYVLIAGRLLCFKLVRSVRTARSRQNNGIFHRRQDTVIHLRDAYVYSGKLSEDMLQSGRSDPAQAVSGIGGGGSNSGERHRIPRVFADGLFSTDEDEDCTFVIRYRPERANTPADPTVPTLDRDASAETAPATAAKGKAKASCHMPSLQDKTFNYIAMRARSKMERDLWVRCIAYEIERIVRDDLDRETRLKNTGKVDFKK